MRRAFLLFSISFLFILNGAISSHALQTNGVGAINVKSFTLTASDAENNDLFGISVAIDGNTAVVGAAEAHANNQKGQAYVFVKPPSGWSNMSQTAILTASDGQPGDGFGYSVAISGDTVVVGAVNATVNGNLGQGAAYVFVKPAGGWNNMTETAKLTESDGVEYSNFGSSDFIVGSTVVVGAPQPPSDFPGPGSAYVFVQPVGGWSNMTQTAELSASDAQVNGEFGWSVSMNGSTVVIGAQEAQEAYVFSEPSGGWVNTTETAKLTASDGKIGDAFGDSVSINGNTVVVGASNHVAGAAYVFVEPPGGWINATQTAELTIGKSGSCLGISTSIYGNVILAGADCRENFTGDAFVFFKPAAGWKNTLHYNLELSIPFNYWGDFFGASAALSGKTGIVGAPYAPTSPFCDDTGCQNGPGEAFIFTQ